jgi:hypothetical protein
MYTLAAKMGFVRANYVRIQDYCPFPRCVNTVVYISKGSVCGKIDAHIDVPPSSDAKQTIQNTLQSPMFLIVNEKHDVTPVYRMFEESIRNLNIHIMTLVNILLAYNQRLVPCDDFEINTLYVLDSESLSEITLKVEDLMK